MRMCLLPSALINGQLTTGMLPGHEAQSAAVAPGLSEQGHVHNNTLLSSPWFLTRTSFDNLQET